MIDGGAQGNAAATASIAEANIARDGADKNDIHEIIANELLPVEQKIGLQLQQHPEMMDELEEFASKNNIQEPTNLQEFGAIVKAFLQNVRGYGEGGQFESVQN